MALSQLWDVSPSEKRWRNSVPTRPLMYPFGIHGQTVCQVKVQRQ